MSNTPDDYEQAFNFVFNKIRSENMNLNRSNTPNTYSEFVAQYGHEDAPEKFKQYVFGLHKRLYYVQGWYDDYFETVWQKCSGHSTDMDVIHKDFESWVKLIHEVSDNNWVLKSYH